MLVITILFTFSFPVYGADATGDFSINDCTVICSTLSNSGVTTNVSNDVTIQDYSSGSYNGMRAYAFPSWSEGELRSSVKVRLVEDFSVRADHEYNLKFRWSYNYGTQCNFTVSLRFLNASGTVIKSQDIYSVSSPGNSKIYSFDLNFTPVVPENETGYKCDLYLEFNQVAHGGTTPQRFYISQTLSLTDLDDDTKELNGILEAILSIPEKIKGFFVDLGNTILDGIKNLFIPDEEYLANKKVELETFCIEHFGAVYQSIDVFIDFLNSLVNISPSEPKITFPAIDVPVMGTTYHLTDAFDYSFAWVNDSSHFLYYFYNFYRGFVTVILFLGFVNYCRNKYAEVFGGDKE